MEAIKKKNKRIKYKGELGHPTERYGERKGELIEDEGSFYGSAKTPGGHKASVFTAGDPSEPSKMYMSGKYKTPGGHSIEMGGVPAYEGSMGIKGELNLGSGYSAAMKGKPHKKAKDGTFSFKKRGKKGGSFEIKVQPERKKVGFTVGKKF